MSFDEAKAILGDQSEDWSFNNTLGATWRNDDDYVRFYCWIWSGRVVGKSAVIRGHEFHDPAITRSTRLDRWRGRLGL
jgi:hypothetical protein